MQEFFLYCKRDRAGRDAEQRATLRAMTPAQFIAKRRAAGLEEKSAAQTHFKDLCTLLGVPGRVAADPKSSPSEV
jgi:hypothetical protein